MDKHRRDYPTVTWQDRRTVIDIIRICSVSSVVGATIVILYHCNYWSQNDLNDVSTSSWLMLVIKKILVGLLLLIGWYFFVSGSMILILCIFISNPPSTNPIAFRNFMKRRQQQHEANNNNKDGANQQQRIQTKNLPPVLVCFGDSLMLGTVSSNFINQVPLLFAQRNNHISEQTNFNSMTKNNNRSSWWLPKMIDKYYTSFRIDDPLWVINVGSNGITSHVLVQEEWVEKTYHAILDDSNNNSTTMASSTIMTQRPHYVLIMIGTNDVLCMTSKMVRDMLQRTHKPTGTIINDDDCTVSTFELNLRSLIRTILSYYSSNDDCTTEIAICTIPPIGEDDSSISMFNTNVEKLNDCIDGIVTSGEFSKNQNITIIPVYKECRKAIIAHEKEKRQQQQQQNQKDKIQQKKKKNANFELGILACYPTNLLHYVTLGTIPRSSTWISGPDNKLLMKDNVHLNETGRDIIAHLVTDWIIQKQKQQQQQMVSSKKDK